MTTYSEYVQYFLNNGASLKLAQVMARSKTRYKTFDCPKCGCQNIVNVKEESTGISKNSKEIKSAAGLIDFIKNYVDIEYEYNPCIKDYIPVVNLDRVVELINEYCESEDEECR